MWTMGCVMCKTTPRSGKIKDQTPDEGKGDGKTFNSKFKSKYFSNPDFNPVDYTPVALTKQQRDLVKKVWAKISKGPDMLKNSAASFSRFFIMMPESRLLFHFIKDDLEAFDETELLKSAIMRKHMTFVMKFLDHAVNELDQDSFNTKTCHLGQRHFDYDVRPDYLKALLESFLYTLEKILWQRKEQEDALKAFEQFFLNISHHFLRGMSERKRKSVDAANNPNMIEQLEAIRQWLGISDEAQAVASAADSHRTRRDSKTKRESLQGFQNPGGWIVAPGTETPARSRTPSLPVSEGDSTKKTPPAVISEGNIPRKTPPTPTKKLSASANNLDVLRSDYTKTHSASLISQGRSTVNGEPEQEVSGE